jgi:hypothetical protein
VHGRKKEAVLKVIRKERLKEVSEKIMMNSKRELVEKSNLDNWSKRQKKGS